MKNKKLAFFLPDLSGGGAERVILNIAGEFSRRGFDIDLLLMEKTGNFLEYAEKNFNIVDLGSRRALFSVLPLAKYLRMEKPAALLSTLLPANLAAVAAKMISFHDFRLVLREALFFSYLDCDSDGNLKNRFLKAAAKCLYRFSDCLIALAEEGREDLVRSLWISGEKVKVINNPVDLGFVRKKMLEPAGHEWFSGERDFKIVLGAGRLRKRKGFDLLIKAFAALRREKNIRLVILGEGEQRGELEALARNLGLDDEVLMPGFADNPYSYMRAADVFVLSSYSEGMPNVLIEALACGAPVVSTDCPSGPAEILKGGGFGRLVPVGNAEAMSAAIGDMLDNPPAPGAAEKKAEDFALEKIAGEYLGVMIPKG